MSPKTFYQPGDLEFEWILKTPLESCQHGLSSEEGDADLFERFPSTEAVNGALRSLLKRQEQDAA